MIIKFKNYNNHIIATIILLFIFAINISIEYSKYLDFTNEEIYETKVEVLNVYEKPKFNILRLKAQDISFFTKIDKSEDIKRFDFLNMAIVTVNISFLEYLKGFNTKNVA